MTSSVKEIWTQMITEMNADSEITDIIGANNIHRINPPVKLAFPNMIIEITLGPISQLSGVGLYRPSLTFNVFASDHDNADDMMRALEAGWTIPFKRPQGINTSNYSITQMQFTNLIEVGNAEVVDTGEVVTHFVIPATLRLISYRD